MHYIITYTLRNDKHLLDKEHTEKLWKLWFSKKRMMIPESNTLKINSTDRCETLAHAVYDTEKERILSALEKMLF